MTDRLQKIFSIIPECEVFADIGCDHGYIAQAMLKSNKANKVIISDISEKCLQKAQELLYPYIKSNRAQSVVSNGFEKIPYCDVALIAGMGGEEICSILTNAKSLPKILVLQPMKNADKVRLLAVNKGYKVVKDYLFKSASKFYDLMLLVEGQDHLTDEEIEFGRDNLNLSNQDFKEFLSVKIERINCCLMDKKLSNLDREKMLKQKEKLQKYV